MDVDAVRLVALITCSLALALFPISAARQGRQASAWWAVIGAEIMFVSAILSVRHFWGTPLAWYRAPATIAGSVCFLVFIALTWGRPSR